MKYFIKGENKAEIISLCHYMLTPSDGSTALNHLAANGNFPTKPWLSMVRSGSYKWCFDPWCYIELSQTRWRHPETGGEDGAAETGHGCSLFWKLRRQNQTALPVSWVTAANSKHLHSTFTPVHLNQSLILLNQTDVNFIPVIFYVWRVQ